MEETFSKKNQLGTIMIVHKDDDTIASLSFLLKEKGFFSINVSSGLEAIKKIDKKQDISVLIIQENNMPLNAYKTIEYIKTELHQNPYCIVLKEFDENETIDSDKLALVDSFYIAHDGYEGLLKDLYNYNKIEVNVKAPSTYSLGYLKEVSGGFTEFIEESLQIFSTSVAKDIEELYLKNKSGDYEDIREIAHKIKPSFAMIENHKGIELCDKITYQAEDKELKKLIENLHSEFIKIENDLKKDYPNLNL